MFMEILKSFICKNYHVMFSENVKPLLIPKLVQGIKLN